MPRCVRTVGRDACAIGQVVLQLSRVLYLAFSEFAESAQQQADQHRRVLLSNLKVRIQEIACFLIVILCVVSSQPIAVFACACVHVDVGFLQCLNLDSCSLRPAAERVVFGVVVGSLDI